MSGALKSWLRHARKGCGDLPHVGPHPGTPVLALMIMAGGLAGALSERWDPMLAACLGALVTGAPLGALYLTGAVARSRASAAIERRHRGGRAE